MVSLGPTIRNAHSPDEEVHVASVARTYKYLLELLKDLA
jgi:dipeptidase D